MDIKNYIFVLCLVVLAKPQKLRAIEYNASLYSIVSASNNLIQTTDKQSGTALSAGIRFALLSEESENFIADLEGVLGNTSYSDNRVTNDQQKAYLGRLYTQPRDTNFSFSALSSFSQTPTNRLITQEINNISDVKVNAIQPGYYLNISRTDRLNFFYILSTLSSRDFDNRTSNKFALAYEKELSAINSLFFVATEDNVTFDSVEDEYTQKDIFLRWQQTRLQFLITVDLGESQIDSNTFESSDRLIQRLQINRTLNSRSSLSFEYRKGNMGILTPNYYGDGLKQVNVNRGANFFATPVAEKGFQVQYNYTGTFYTSNFQFASVLRQPEGLPLEETKTFRANVIYDLTRSAKMTQGSSLELLYDRANNLVGELDLRTSRLRLRLNYMFTPETLLFVELSDRKADDALTSGNTDSTSINFGFSYTPIGNRFRQFALR